MTFGKLVLYDRFGSENNVLAPSSYIEDYGLAVVLSEVAGGKVFTVLCDDGVRRAFSSSYLKMV
jgi:hypothetical protein